MGSDNLHSLRYVVRKDIEEQIHPVSLEQQSEIDWQKQKRQPRRVPLAQDHLAHVASQKPSCAEECDPIYSSSRSQVQVHWVYIVRRLRKVQKNRA